MSLVKESEKYLLELMLHQPARKIKTRLCNLFKLNFSIFQAGIVDSCIFTKS